MEGVELAARFASVTNRLKYCGSAEFQSVFGKYLADKSAANTGRLKAAIGKFEAHYPYLKLIAKANGRKPFDYPVVEALWLGNGLLEKVTRKQMQQMILGGLTGKGKMDLERARRKADGIPEGALPHHSFHVYYIRFITGRVEWNLRNADRCRVPWGYVREVDGEAALVEYTPIIRRDGNLVFSAPIVKRVALGLGGIGFGNMPKKGDTVAFHWDAAIKKLTAREEANLRKYTLINMVALNEGRKGI